MVSPRPRVPTASETLDPTDAPAGDAGHLRRITAARAGVEEANTELHLAVQAAREAGVSWARIAAALEASRRSVLHRSGHASGTD